MIDLSGISGVSGTGTAELMKVLEESMQANMDLAEKIVKLANSAQVSEAEATGLGKMVDLYA
ncbi:MAG: hypothetical protein GQF41_2298 [Candidatus Rifleibacterium amylolyticum]|nr:MAG: hypothetical protein GQF41_2298 [Candidatus Rifleibacterium amylolyticum]NLF96934.1 hypothetical protein [Candidatus Riflebacteria bacterium]